MVIKQTQKLIETKEIQIKQLNESSSSQEVQKADKMKELSDFMHRSISKVEAIRTKQFEEMAAYEEAELKAVNESKKKIHYEQIRITEESKSLAQSKEELDEQLAGINEKVYEDTKPQQVEKHKLDGMIDELTREIEEIMMTLERKKKEKEMLELEKQVHEKKID